MVVPEPPRESNRMTLRKVALVACVVAIVLLSSLLAFYYRQAEDYRTSKYRSQFDMVIWARDSIDSALTGIDGMYNASVTAGPGYTESERMSRHVEYADLAHNRLWELRKWLGTIQAEYPTGSKEDRTMGALAMAAEIMSTAVGDVASYMRLNVTDGWAYVEDTQAKTILLADCDTLKVIQEELRGGYAPNRDPQTSPYSLLNRMDLDAIYQESMTITDRTLPLVQPT